MNTQQAKIFYIYDALCGWCYGFSPVINEFHTKYADDFDFQVLSGGLVTGNRVGPIGVVASYIKDAYKEVELRTGVKFGDAFLEEILEAGNELFSSIPPAMAMGLFRNQLPKKQVEFASRIQKAIYYEGLPPAEWTTYGTCASDFGLNPDEFAEKMQHPKLEELVHQEFQVVSQWGIKGFPALLVLHNNKAYPVTKGYTDLESLEQNFSRIREMISL